MKLRLWLFYIKRACLPISLSHTHRYRNAECLAKVSQQRHQPNSWKLNLCKLEDYLHVWCWKLKHWKRKSLHEWTSSKKKKEKIPWCFVLLFCVFFYSFIFISFLLKRISLLVRDLSEAAHQLLCESMVVGMKIIVSTVSETVYSNWWRCDDCDCDFSELPKKWKGEK